MRLLTGLGLVVFAVCVVGAAGCGEKPLEQRQPPQAPGGQAPRGPAAAERTAQPAVEKKDIVETAVAAGQFGTLAKALEAGGLVETLKGAGPFTVFAPTDEAFAKLPAGTLDDLLKPENKEKLRAILTYHVVPGKYMAEDVAEMTSAPTVNGKDLAIKFEEGVVMVAGGRVIEVDVEASNGVIHVIDEVMMP